MKGAPGEALGPWFEGWEKLAAGGGGAALAGQLPALADAYARFAAELWSAAQRARQGTDTSIELRLERELAGFRERFRAPPFDTLMGATPPSVALAGGWLGPLLAAGALPELAAPTVANPLAAALLNFKAPAEAYASALSHIALEGLTRFTAALAKLLDGGHEATPSVLFDEWVECSEAAYQSALAGEDFPRVQARAFNAWLEVVAASRELAGRQAQLLGWPTRAEVDALDDRLRELERARRDAPDGDA